MENNYPVRKALEFQSFNWNDCYNSFALALYGAIRYSNKTISLPQLLIYTGQAFVLNTDTNVMPMDVFYESHLMAALANLGFDMEVLAAGIYGGEWEADTEERALDMVREGISRGVAVVGWNLDNYEHGLIYGYDDEQRTLLIHDINARTGGELSYDDFGRRARNGTPINPEMFVLVLKVREGAPHLSSTRYSVEEDMSYRVALRTALAMAIRHIEDASQSDDGRFGGIAAIDAWISAFEAGSANPFFTSYNLLWVTSTRQYVCPFFAQSAITHCMSIQDHTLQRLMIKAAEVYLSNYGTWLRLRELFPFPLSANTEDPVLRAEAIRLLREARETEVAGVSILRDIVTHLT